MVQIPTFDSQRQLSTLTTANRITDLSTFTQESVALQRTGQALTNIAEEFKQLNTLRQVSRSTVETSRLLAEEEDKFLSNPDLTESDVIQFNQRSEEIITDQLSAIDDETARLRAGVSFRGTAIVKGFNVKRQGRQADLDNDEIETGNHIGQGVAPHLYRL